MNRMLLAGVVVCSLPAVLDAKLIIDDFSSGAQTLTATAGTIVEDAAGGVMLGGDRNLRLDNFSHSSSASLVVEPGKGLVAQNNDFATRSKGMLKYDGISAAGLGDLTGGGKYNALVLEGLAGELEKFVLRVRVESSGQKTFQMENSALVAGDMVIPFAVFAGVDFTEVKLLKIEMHNPAKSGDMAIFAVAAVPEPSTFILVALGLVAPALVVRRLHSV